MRLGGCVVIYNPEGSVTGNISTYAPFLDRLYVADNSDSPDSDMLQSIRNIGDNIEILPMNGNKGIAAALNACLRAAARDGEDYLLTMDDDSYFTGDTLPEYIKRAQKFFEEGERVIQTGIHNSGDKDDDKVVNREDPEWLITSGSIMDVKKSIEVGGFLEKLFIDEVDREFCYRAADAGYKFKRVLDLTMQHNLGAPIKGRIFGREFEAMGHNRVRKYYIFRNCTYVMKNYPRTRKPYRYFLFTQFVKTLLAEDDKAGKIRYMRMGRRDARRGKFGKIEV